MDMIQTAFRGFQILESSNLMSVLLTDISLPNYSNLTRLALPVGLGKYILLFGKWPSG